MDDQDHPGTLTADAVPDIYAFAARLARDGAMAEPRQWFSKVDQGFDAGAQLPSTFVDPHAAGAVAVINPKFQCAPLAFAVALFPKGTHLATLPPTTPLAWTRGLQTNGAWRADSPYGTVGGFVFFAGNNLQYFKGSIRDGFVKFGTQQPTSDILEALPPGTRISEYKPPAKSP